MFLMSIDVDMTSMNMSHISHTNYCAIQHHLYCLCASIIVLWLGEIENGHEFPKLERAGFSNNEWLAHRRLD